MPRALRGPCHVKGCPNLSDCAKHKRRSVANSEGVAHQRERAAWQRRIDSGETVLCRRCKQPIPPGMPFDLGHPEPKHPEHIRCNRSTMGRDRS